MAKSRKNCEYENNKDDCIRSGGHKCAWWGLCHGW